MIPAAPRRRIALLDRVVVDRFFMPSSVELPACWCRSNINLRSLD